MPAVRNRSPYYRGRRNNRERNRLVDLLLSRIDRRSSTDDEKCRLFAAAYAPAVYPTSNAASSSASSSFAFVGDFDPCNTEECRVVADEEHDPNPRSIDSNGTTTTGRGIPWLAKRFRTFDPLNDPAAGLSHHTPLSPVHLRVATERDFYHLDRYLLSDEFNVDRLLRKRDVDHVACAIYSFALSWDDESLQRYISRPVTAYRASFQLPTLLATTSATTTTTTTTISTQQRIDQDNGHDDDDDDHRTLDEHRQPHPGAEDSTSSLLPFDSLEASARRRSFVVALAADRASSNVTCFLHPDGFAYSRSTFRSLTRALNADTCGDDEQRLSPLKSRPFRLSDHLPYRFRDELDRLYRALVRGEAWLATWDPARLAPIPYDLQRRLGSYERMKRVALVKFVTGQACCGKTSVLNRLTARGWMVFSRGALGSFAGKASDPLAVFGLHAAIDWTLRRDNTLGDRCSIDNPLWRFIMPLCDPSVSSAGVDGSECCEFVDRLFEFIDAAFNEPTIGYLIEQHGAVFVDPRVQHCANRMLRRGTGGDAQRGRLCRYASAQCLAYYAMARLFGWRVYTVPYLRPDPECSELDGQRFNAIAEEIGDWFSSLRASDDRRLVDRLRPPSLPSVAAGGFARVAGTWDADMSYPRAVSIYK